MTAQVQDSVEYLGEQYALAAFAGGEPFSPINAGCRPFASNTACWRGYVSGYDVAEGRVYLRQLWVNHYSGDAPLGGSQPPPNINGVAAMRDEESFLEWRYGDVHLPLPYTGGLLIGRDFVAELYVHMGFHPAWTYRSVCELVFDCGQLVEARDVSDEMAQLRAHKQAGMQSGSETTSRQMDERLSGCLRHEYR